MLMIFNTLFLVVHLGATVHACQKAGQHFVVMEEDEDIFKSVLEPLIVEPASEVSKKMHSEAQGALNVSEEEMEPPPPVFACLNRYST
jgi:hypothetical protein